MATQKEALSLLSVGLPFGRILPVPFDAGDSDDVVILLWHLVEPSINSISVVGVYSRTLQIRPQTATLAERPHAKSFAERPQSSTLQG